MTAIKLEAQPRTITGKAVKRLRLEGKVPAILYGREIQPRNLFVLYNPFKKVLEQAGESTLVDLYLDGEAHKVLIVEVDRDPLSGNIRHIDFREVKMTEKLEADIQLRFTSESRAVKELGAILVKSVSEVKVRCLPQHLVHEIEVELALLQGFGSAIRVSDIRVPEGIEILTNADTVIATAVQPKEEEAAAPAAPVDLSAIKTAGEEKRAAKEAEKKAEEAK